jgi:hypothetical protein
MKLSLEIPLLHWDTFYPLCDFDYCLLHLLRENKQYRDFYKYEAMLGRPLWLDNGFNETKTASDIDEILWGIDTLNPSHVFCMEAKDSLENLKFIIRTKDELQKRGIKKKLICVWRGGMAEMEVMKNLVDLVALSYDDNRSYILKKVNPAKHHFLGFRNLDELRIHKPMSLDTSVPIRCAMLGINLKDRMRRPKVLPHFSPMARLSKEQLNLALENITLIKEAGNAEKE